MFPCVAQLLLFASIGFDRLLGLKAVLVLGLRPILMILIILLHRWLHTLGFETIHMVEEVDGNARRLGL